MLFEVCWCSCMQTKIYSIPIGLIICALVLRCIRAKYIEHMLAYVIKYKNNADLCLEAEMLLYFYIRQADWDCYEIYIIF